MQPRTNDTDNEKSEEQCAKAFSLTVLFFPKAAISNFALAGLLTCFTFCGLPVIITVAIRIQKAFYEAYSIG